MRIRRPVFRLGIVVGLTLSVAACRGCAGDTEMAFCDAVNRRDGAAAKAIFDAGEINMMARDSSGQCQPGWELFDMARADAPPAFTEMAVAFAAREGVANSGWSGGGSSSGSRAGRPSGSGGTSYPLEVAARHTNVALVRALLDAGATPNDRIAANAVSDAANLGALEIVKLLVEKGANPRAGLNVAVASRQQAVVEYLESKGAVEDVDPLLVAARRGDLPGVDAAIARKANLDVIDGWGRTPLYRAALYGHPAVVARLAKAGANLEAMTPEEGHTALHVAANENHAVVIQALAAAKANVDARKDPSAQTPLLVAVNNGAIDAVKALLAAGADPNVWTENDTTAIRRAALAGHFAITTALLAAGARVSDAHGTGWQPPLDAVVGLCGPLPAGDTANDYYRINVIKALLAAGADRTAKNAEGKTPLEVATGLLAGATQPFYRECYQAKITLLSGR